MKRTMNMKKFFAPSASGLGGAVRRAATALLLCVLTMIVQSAWAETVTTYYIDRYGTRHDVTATVLTSITGNYQSIPSYNGWLIVNSDIDILNNWGSDGYPGIRLDGETHLILADGCTMNIGTAEKPISYDTPGAGIAGNTDLYIYGQNEQTGQLNIVTAGNSKYGIKVNIYKHFGGNVNITSKGNNSIGIYAEYYAEVCRGSLTIDSDRHGIKTNQSSNLKSYVQTGGNVSLTSGIFALYCTTNSPDYNTKVQITGGTFSASGGTYGIYANSQTVTLGWTNATDRIYASTFCGNSSMTRIEVANGQYLTDGTNVYSGRLNVDEKAAIDGKTLRPSPFTSGTGTADDPWIISSASGWNLFCDLLANNASGYFTGKTVKLGDDISVTRMADGQPFTGTFDGDGHTLTLNYGTADAPVDAQFVAPFVATSADGSNQPVFRNLTIDGTIYDSYSGSEAHNVGGLIGHLYGDVTIDHCTSNLTITSVGGAGGFVGLCEHTAMFTDCKSSVVITSPGGNNSGFVSWSRASGHAISFEGCVFNGKLLQQNGEGSSNGGFIGWTGSNKTVTITNSLCAPAATTTGETMATYNSATFARGWNATTTATNSYYTTTLGTAQGKQARSITAGQWVTVSHAGVANTYSASGITAYKANSSDVNYTAGIAYAPDGDTPATLYAGSGDVVSLTLGHEDRQGYTFNYQASAGTISGTENPYTLTMPDADVTITVGLSVIDWATESDGDADHPYMIYNKDQLDLLAQRVNNGTSDYKDKYFKLGNDIIYDPDELTIDNDNDGTNDSNYKAIGYNGRSFNGHFDGDNKTVSGIRIYKGGTGDGDSYQGLFGRTGSDADIRNVTLADADITGSKYTGGIVGENVGTVSNCHVAASVFIRAVQKEAHRHGGIVGHNSSTVTNCTSRSTLTIAKGITGCQHYGSIAGLNFGTLTDNLAIGAVVPAADYNTNGAICSNWDGTMARNYYRACKVASENVTQGGVGCHNRDVTDNNGAVPACTLTLDTGITTTSETVINIDDEDYYAGTITLSGDLPDGAPEHYTYAYTVNGNAISGNTFIISADATVGIGLGPADWANEGNSGDDEDHAYIIYNKDQLNLLAHRVNGTNSETANDYEGKYFKLGNDITYNPDELTIDNDNDGTNDSNYEAIKGFNGHFDGDDKTVSGIRIYKSAYYGDGGQGLFGWTGSSADIHNVTLANADITGGDYTGGIVGENSGTVSNCHVTATVAIHTVQPDVWDHGGIVGANYGTVSECFSAATLTNTGNGYCAEYGGIAGYNEGTMSNNLAIGAVVPEAAENNAYGAICGWNYDGTLENNYYAACTVAGTENATGVGCQNADLTENDGAVPALRDGADNSTALALMAAVPEKFGTYSVSLNGRTLYKDGAWNTLCLPFGINDFSGTPLEGATVMELDVTGTYNGHKTGLDGTTLYLYFKDATSIVAGKPYLVKWPATEPDYVEDPVFQGVTIDSDLNDVDFQDGAFRGSYSYMEWAAGTAYKSILLLGGSNKLFWPDGSAATKLGACRAYFQLSDGQEARQFVLNFGEETTGILSPTEITEITEMAGAWYDLSGRKISVPSASSVPSVLPKGVYIHGGRKVVVK